MYPVDTNDGSSPLFHHTGDVSLTRSRWVKVRYGPRGRGGVQSHAKTSVNGRQLETRELDKKSSIRVGLGITTHVRHYRAKRNKRDKSPKEEAKNMETKQRKGQKQGRNGTASSMARDERLDATAAKQNATLERIGWLCVVGLPLPIRACVIETVICAPKHTCLLQSHAALLSCSPTSQKANTTRRAFLSLLNSRYLPYCRPVLRGKVIVIKRD